MTPLPPSASTAADPPAGQPPGPVDLAALANNASAPTPGRTALRSQVTQGLKWQALAIAGRHFLSLFVFTALARLLDPEAFGLAALAGTFIFLTSIVADLGFGTALVQRADLRPEHCDAAFWAILCLNSVILVVTVALSAPLARVLGDPRLAPLLGWIAFGLLLRSTVAVHAALLVREMNFRAPAARTLVSVSVGGAIAVLVAIAGHGVWALIVQHVATHATGAALIWRLSPYRPAFRFSLTPFRELAAVGVPLLANALLWFLTSRLDQLIIGRFAGVQSLGMYVLGGKLPEVLKLATQQPLADVLIPLMSRLQTEKPRMCDAIYRGSRHIGLVMFAVFPGLSAVTFDVIPLLFGEKWAPAAPVASLLALHSLLGGLTVFFYPAIVASGVTRGFIALNVAQALGVVAACVAGVSFGVTWVVVGLITSNVLLTVPGMLLLRRRIGFDPVRFARSLMVPAAGAAIMLLVLLVTSQLVLGNANQIVRVVVLVLVGAGSYIATVAIADRSLLVESVALISSAARGKRTPSPL